MVNALSLQSTGTSASPRLLAGLGTSLAPATVSCKRRVAMDRISRGPPCQKKAGRCPTSAARHACRRAPRSSSCSGSACLTLILRTPAPRFCGASIPFVLPTLTACCSSRNPTTRWRGSWQGYFEAPAHLFQRVASERLRNIFGRAKICLATHPIQLPQFIGDLRRARRFRLRARLVQGHDLRVGYPSRSNLG